MSKEKLPLKLSVLKKKYVTMINNVCKKINSYS